MSGIGAAIHNWIPEQWITALLGQEHWYSVLIATIVGVPMYADIFGTLPIAEALLLKALAWGRFSVYDGGHRTFSAIANLVKTSGENPLIEPVCRDCFCGNLDCWL